MAEYSKPKGERFGYPMNTKNDVEVVINGKQYTLCGYESSDYLQHIATHINDKYGELKQQDGYNRLDVDMRNIMLAINLSDDYFKAQKLVEEFREQKEELEKEFFNIKHELLSSQDEVKKLEQQVKESGELLEEAKGMREETERRMIRLEAELEQSRPVERTDAESHQQEMAGDLQEDKIEEKADGEKDTKRNSYKSGDKRTQKRKK